MWGEIFLPQGISLELIGFLIGSYFLGLTLSEVSSEFGHPLKNVELPHDYQALLPLYQYIFENYDDRVLNQYERMNFMMAAGAAIGTSSLLGVAFMVLLVLYRYIFNAELPPNEYLLLTVGLLIYGYCMVRNSERQKKRVQDELKSLTDGIVTNNKVSETQF